MEKNGESKWKGEDAVILKLFDATVLLNAPFKVILKDAVKQVYDEKGCVVETIIPDPKGLVKAVALSRVMHPHKLNGAELKFLRSALGMKSKDLAKAIAITPEHMSRLEANDKVLSPQSEMLVRIFTFVSTLGVLAIEKESVAVRVAKQVSRIFEKLNIRACHSVDEIVELTLVRVAPPSPSTNINDENEETWNEEKEAKEPKAA